MRIKSGETEGDELCSNMTGYSRRYDDEVKSVGEQQTRLE